jgi:hypothetical protein
MSTPELQPRNSVNRIATRFSAKLDKDLLAYAAAASAAGVSLLALAQPTEAKIIYTPAHKSIGSSTPLDLNHDGITDFKLDITRSSFCEGGCTTQVRHATAFQATYGDLTVSGARPQNQVFGQGKYASALAAGVSVGPDGQFPAGKIMASAMAISGNNEYSRGPWGTKGGVQNRYLGLKFTIHGKTHYGWARLSVAVSSGAHIQATLTGYAYETVANKPIITGKKHGADNAIDRSLGDLARGASSIPASRLQYSAH